MEPIETISKENYVGKIFQDDEPLNPRENDNLSTMICFHRHYNLGDKHNLSIQEAKAIEEREDLNFVLPLYFYDHSMQSISTRSFIGRAHHAEWDSGGVGFIYVSKEKVRKEWKVKRISPKLRERILKNMEAEVVEYDLYLRGEVYGYQIFKDDEEVDSCWGFFGLEEVQREVNSTLDYFITH